MRLGDYPNFTEKKIMNTELTHGDKFLVRGLSRIGIAGTGPSAESIVTPVLNLGLEEIGAPDVSCELVIMVNGIVKCGREKTLRLFLTADTRLASGSQVDAAQVDAVIHVSDADERRLFNALLRPLHEPALFCFDFPDLSAFFRKNPSKNFQSFVIDVGIDEDLDNLFSSPLKYVQAVTGTVHGVLFLLTAGKKWGLREIDRVAKAFSGMIDGPLIYSAIVDDRLADRAELCVVFF